MKILARERVKAGQIICQTGLVYQKDKTGQGAVVGIAKFDCLQGGVIDCEADFSAIMKALGGEMGRVRV